jgi:hypothetical protein
MPPRSSMTSAVNKPPCECKLAPGVRKICQIRHHSPTTPAIASHPITCAVRLGGSARSIVRWIMSSKLPSCGVCMIFVPVSGLSRAGKGRCVRTFEIPSAFSGFTNRRCGESSPMDALIPRIDHGCYSIRPTFFPGSQGSAPGLCGGSLSATKCLGSSRWLASMYKFAST